jgi:hypothetical protein
MLSSIVLVMTSIMTVQLYANDDHVPQFCKDNFPLVRGRTSLNLSTMQAAAGDGKVCSLSVADGLSVSLPAEDLLNFYQRVQTHQYRDVSSNFRDIMREKVARRIVRSREMYMDQFPRVNCDHITNRARQRECNRDNNIELNACVDPKLRAVIEDEQRKIDDELNARANLIVETFVEENELTEAISPEDISHARKWMNDGKRAEFMASNLKAALEMNLLMEDRRQAERIYQEQMDTVSIPFYFRDGRDEAIARRDSIEKNHEIIMQEIQLKISKLYEAYPAVVDIETTRSWIVFQDSDYKPSPFAQELLRQIPQLPVSFDINNRESVDNFLKSDEADFLIGGLAGKLYNTMPPQLLETGRAQVLAQLRNSREAMEGLCKNSSDQLHHFSDLALETFVDAADDPAEFLNRQAGYCYLVQRYPYSPGGAPTWALVAAGSAMVAGVALQFIPGLGTVAGASAFAWGAGIAFAGGAVFTADAVHRYSTDLGYDRDQQAVYYGDPNWTSAEAMRASRDRLVTSGRLAVLEVGFSAADVAFVGFRPARAALLGSKRAATSPAATSTALTTTRVADTAPILPTYNPPAALPGPRAAPAPQLPGPSTPPAPAGTASALPLPPVGSTTDGLAGMLRAAPDSAINLSAADRVILNNFSVLPIAQRRQFADRIMGMIRSGEEVTNAQYMALFMTRGGYTSSVFSSGPQALARAVREADNAEDAIRLIRNYYEGIRGPGQAMSPESARRMNDLISMVEEMRAPGTAIVRAGDNLPAVVRTTDVVVTGGRAADDVIDITAYTMRDVTPRGPLLLTDGASPFAAGMSLPQRLARGMMTYPEFLRPFTYMARPPAQADEPANPVAENPPSDDPPAPAPAPAPAPEPVPTPTPEPVVEEPPVVLPRLSLDINANPQGSNVLITAQASFDPAPAEGAAPAVSYEFTVVSGEGAPDPLPTLTAVEEQPNARTAPLIGQEYSVKVVATAEGYEPAEQVYNVLPLGFRVQLTAGEADASGRVPLTAGVFYTGFDDKAVDPAHFNLVWTRSDGGEVTRGAGALEASVSRTTEEFTVTARATGKDVIPSSTTATSEPVTITPMDSSLNVSITQTRKNNPVQIELKVVVSADGGQPIQRNNVTIKWLSPIISTSERERHGEDVTIVNPEGATGVLEHTVTARLYPVGYTLVVEAKEGSARYGVANVFIPSCLLIEGALCEGEEDEVPFHWPTFAPRNPPARFQPVQLPSPQLYVVPGFF